MACGGETDDDETGGTGGAGGTAGQGGIGGGPTEEELFSQIQEEADRINSCATVDDCYAVGFACSSLYVNADADRTRLEELIAEHTQRFGGVVGCPGACACGILSCEASRCVTDSGDCMSAPPGSMMVCL